MEKVASLRKCFQSGLTLNLEFRKAQLNALLRLVTENAPAMCDALKKDLNKCEHDSLMTEVHMLRKEVEYFIKNLTLLAAPEKVAKTFITLTDSTYIVPQPYGVVLVISAWNYPILLCMQPVVGALAAGNCVLVKPSELAPATERLIAELIPKYLDQGCCQVVCGGPQATGDLLKERFDYIFYTGSTQVGRVIMQAAALHLTPVTLELGGKSPTYIHEDCNVTMAAHRVAWGKFINCGQTCVAPDYVLCHEKVLEEFIEKLKQTVNEFYGEDASKSPDFCRIINERHFDRLQSLMSETQATVVMSGEHRKEDKYIAPTIFRDVKQDDALMKSELFGPLLPIVTVKSFKEAIHFINEREKPLALYVFTKSTDVMKAFEQQTFSGGLVHNDTIMHLGVLGLPFGGIGESGMGNYHGPHSFHCFSHKRAVLNKDTNEMFNYKLRYPPYTSSKTSWMNWALSTQQSKCNVL